MRDHELPALSHLQFLVVGILLPGERSGRSIRRILEQYQIPRSAPAFYQMMARLERDGIVLGTYEQIKVGDQSVTERRYRATRAGARLWERSYSFYEHVRLGIADHRWSDA